MKILVISKFDVLYNDTSIETQIKELDETLAEVKELKEKGIVLDIFGVPGVEKTIMIIEAESIYHVEQLFADTFNFPNVKHELYYISDFTKALEMKRDLLVEKTKE